MRLELRERRWMKQRKTPPKNLCDKRNSIKKICLIYYFRLLVLLLIVCLFVICYLVPPPQRSMVNVGCLHVLVVCFSFFVPRVLGQLQYKDSVIIDIFQLKLVCFCVRWVLIHGHFFLFFFPLIFVLSILHLWSGCATHTCVCVYIRDESCVCCVLKWTCLHLCVYLCVYVFNLCLHAEFYFSCPIWI